MVNATGHAYNMVKIDCVKMIQISKFEFEYT